MNTKPEKILLAKPRGFCAGVERAIEVVEKALEVFPAPVYVYHEIVHNTHVVKNLGSRGAVFVDDLEEVPDGSVVIFSAHGISPEIRQTSQRKAFRVIDATCPLVTKVHVEAVQYARNGNTILLVGHEGHDEVIGTMGEAPDRIILIQTPEEVQTVKVPDPEKVAVITQTTLSLDDTRDIIASIRKRFPKAQFPPKDDICYATQNRQLSVKQIAEKADLILVIGSENSSNSARLAEVSQVLGARAYLIDDVTKIKSEWLEGVRVVGITAGASAPENLVQEVVEYFKKLGANDVEEVEVVREEVHFGIPADLSREIAEKAGAHTIEEFVH